MSTLLQDICNQRLIIPINDLAQYPGLCQQVQVRLIALGFLPCETADSKFGPKTIAAFHQFKTYYRLAQPDLIGPDTAKKLIEAKRENANVSFFQGGDKAVTDQVFNQALKFVLQWEGGYVNNLADKGGETNKGITWKTYNAYRDRKGLPRQSVQFIKDSEVADIYKSCYWDAPHCDQMPPKLAQAVFDWHINSGRGITYLQECLGVSADGKWGPATAKALQQVLAQPNGEKDLLNHYLQRREAAYRRWATGNQRQFLAGWLNRLNALKSKVLFA